MQEGNNEINPDTSDGQGFKDTAKLRKIKEFNDFDNKENTSLKKGKDLGLKLNNVEIRTTSNIVRPATILEMDGNVICSVGDFSLITGKAKSKKGFLLNLTIAALINDNGEMGRFKSFLPPDKKKVLYFDTEQSRYHVFKAVKRISNQTGQIDPENLFVYALRPLSFKERLEYIEYSIYNTEGVGLVSIDGLRDLVASINDDAESAEIVSKLMKWTHEKQIHIITVLHQNKGNEQVRGHLGSEAVNKAQTIFLVSKSTNDKDISIVEASYSREIDFESFGFTVNQYGIPVFIDEHDLKRATKSEKNRKFDPMLDFDFVTKIEIVRKAFENESEFKYKELWVLLKSIIHEIHSKEISNTKAQEFLTDCKNNGFIEQKKPKGSYTISLKNIDEL